MPAKVWFVTGISRGMGEALAKELLAQGEHVIGTTRDGKSRLTTQGKEGTLHVLKLDVADHDACTKVTQEAHKIHGRLDVVFNNAGYGILGPVEEISLEDAKQQLDVLFFAPLAIMKAALPFMRAQRSGILVNNSSIFGHGAIPGGGYYAAGKHALEGICEALSPEVAAFGIKVILIEPGHFRTDILGGVADRFGGKHPIEDYAPLSGVLKDSLRQMSGNQPGDPAEAAKQIIAITKVEKPPLRLLLGNDAIDFCRNYIESLKRDFDTWEHVTRSTDFKNVPL